MTTPPQEQQPPQETPASPPEQHIAPPRKTPTHQRNTHNARNALTTQQLAYNGAAGGRGGFRLNEDMLHNIIAFTQAGNYQTTAAQAVGVTPTTLYAWRRRGTTVLDKLTTDYGEEAIDTYDDTSQSPYTDDELHPNDWMCYRLAFALNKATAQAEVYAVAQVRSAMDGSWQAAMTWLERKHPDRWKRRDAIEVAQVQRRDEAEDKAMLAPAAQAALEQGLRAAAVEGSAEDA